MSPLKEQLSFEALYAITNTDESFGRAQETKQLMV
jgi:hypothetical protein